MSIVGVFGGGVGVNGTVDVIVGVGILYLRDSSRISPDNVASTTRLNRVVETPVLI